MEKILLTGGNGFLCTRLKKFYEGKYEIIALGKDELNITQGEEVIKVFNRYKPDYVIHAAAIAVTDYCNEHPDIAYKVNVEGAVNVGKACKEVGAKMIFLSSEQVFNGNIEPGPYDEEHVPMPDTVYGQNKLEAEKQLKGIIDELWILRLTWIFALPRHRNEKVNSNIIWGTLENILKNRKIIAPVNEYRGMTYVQELVENFEKIFQIPYGLYHIGSTNETSRYHVVCLIFNELGLENKLKQLVEADTLKYKDNPRDVRVNTDKLARCGVTFDTTSEGIKRCIKEELELCLESQNFRTNITLE